MDSAIAIYIIFIATVLFSSMVRHVSKGGVLLGKWTPVIESIAMFPGKVFLFLEAILLKLILKLQIQDLKKASTFIMKNILKLMKMVIF